MVTNVRLWSAALRVVDSEWTIRNAVDTSRALQLLGEYRNAEPEAGWTIQTRGTEVGWHNWADPIRAAV